MNCVSRVNGSGLVAEELREALRNLIMVIIEGIEKLEKEYSIYAGIGYGLKGGSLYSILDILLSSILDIREYIRYLFIWLYQNMEYILLTT